MSPSEFKAMWKRDLARAGLKQQDIAVQMGMRHTQVTPSAISQWVKQGYPPRSRVDILVDILGPDSEFARVPMATWETLWAKEVDDDMPAFSRKAQDSISPIDTDALRKTLGVAQQPAIDTSLRAVQTAPADGAPKGIFKGMAHLPERYKPLFQRVREACDSELAANFRPPLEDRPRRHIPAYQRNGLVAEFVYYRDSHNLRALMTSALFKLAVLKQKYGREAPRSHVLIVIGEDDKVKREDADTTQHRYPPEEKEQVVDDLARDAKELGVSLGVAANIDDVARYLEDMAFGSINEEPDEHGIEETDPEEYF